GAYHRYAFQPTEAHPTYHIDYPKLGIWPDAYYLSVLDYDSSGWVGASAVALQRDAMLAGRSATDTNGPAKYRTCEIHGPGTAPITLLPTDLQVGSQDPSGLPPNTDTPDST